MQIPIAQVTMMYSFLLLLLSMVCTTELVPETSRDIEMMPLQRMSRAELARIAGYGEERLSSVLVTGTLECGFCLSPGSQLLTFHVPGAKVAIACKTEGQKRKINLAYGTTDEYGEFLIDLPSQLHAIPNLEKSCILRLLQIPSTSYCRLHPTLNSKRIKLSSVGNGIRAYTAGNIRLSRGRTPSYSCSSNGNRNGNSNVESLW